MRIVTADPTGLCFGVKRAITTLEEELKKGRRVFALGSPIHNPQEIARLEKQGLVVVDSPGRGAGGRGIFCAGARSNAGDI